MRSPERVQRTVEVFVGGARPHRRRLADVFTCAALLWADKVDKVGEALGDHDGIKGRERPSC